MSHVGPVALLLALVGLALLPRRRRQSAHPPPSFSRRLSMDNERQRAGHIAPRTLPTEEKCDFIRNYEHNLTWRFQAYCPRLFSRDDSLRFVLG